MASPAHSKVRSRGNLPFSGATRNWEITFVNTNRPRFGKERNQDSLRTNRTIEGRVGESRPSNDFGVATNQVNGALACVLPEDGLYDIENLPSFLAHQVMSPSGKYYGVKLIIIDSVQGHGLSAGATRKYKQVYEFCRQCKSAGITVLLVAHVTKKGDVAGPKDMEHNVDCILVMRRAMIYRPMFVPKNRFGPAIFKPIPLEMDKTTTVLKLSPHSESVSSVARSYLGRQIGIAEAQASVALPAYGNRGKITAPGLPRREIEQLTNRMSQLPDMQIEDLDYTIECRLPGRQEISKPSRVSLYAWP